VIAVIDYGMGNLHSMAKAIEYVGEDVVVTSSQEDLVAAERIVLPGVGAFAECMENLRSTGLIDVLRSEVLEGGKPFLGVCVGMQLLAREGLEHGRHEGLGWLPASVVPLPGGDGVRIPHTGWNEIELGDAAPISPFAAVKSGEAFYFNHSYRMVPEDESLVAARAQHGEAFVAAVARGNIVATQFHPEKSQRAGIDFLADFAVWDPHRAEAPTG
jgi:glutamine amidotransferase